VRFASLGSGSQGNALIVEAGATRLMLDCGFGLRDTVARLGRIGLEPAGLAGIVVTHEHSDHADGVFPLARRFGLPVWMTWGTFSAMRWTEPDAGRDVEVRLVDPDSSFAAGDLEVRPLTVPHDAREPVQYVFGDGARRLGVLTDTGSPTAHIEASLSGCEALVLECNHDRDMLMGGEYPPSLKARIAGRWGHLDNAVSASILCALDRSRLRHVVAAHLSQTNNTPELARAALAGALGCAPEWIAVATQEDGLPWREV
jgi:phosphoribosyl 1,2-cyclic phosphodiesterase